MLAQRLCLLCLVLMAVPAGAAEWSWQWTPAEGQSAAPKAEICEFKYGKDWAYAVEIDDNPRTTLTVVQPLLARFSYTDAPPGVRGGKPMPFVGSAAVIVGSIGTLNNTVLQWDDLKTLRNEGWGIISHSYAHRGHSYGNPPEILTPEQFRTDLFWSQSIFAAEAPDGRAPTHFVYPNGYTDYAKYLAEFGLISGSRVGAGPNNPVYSNKFNLHDLTRSYLDEGYWSHSGKAEPMAMFPKEGPARGILHIDFTHGINPDPKSANQMCWAERLTSIADTYAAKGEDNLWSASTGEVIDYVTARKTAKLKVEAGRLSVQLPENGPGSCLTVRLSGIPAAAKLTAPQGGVLYRDGQTVWVTSPMIGRPGAAAPKPHVRRLYAGPIKDLTFEQPVRIAAVRLLYTAPPPPDFKVQVDAVMDQGTQSLVPEGFTNPKGAWHQWMLLSTVPNRPAVQARGLHVAPEKKSLQAMEVWVLAEPAPATR